MPHLRQLTARQATILAVLSLVALISLIFALVSLVAKDDKTGGSLLYMFPFFAAPMIGCAGAAAMLLLRPAQGSSNGRVAAAMLFWFFGTWLVAFSVTALFIPSDATFFENLGMSAALCLAPGLALILAGLGIYWYDWRHVPAQPAAVAQRLAAPSPANDELADIQARAAEYRRAILDELHRKQRSAFAGYLAAIPDQVEHWQERVGALVHRLQGYQADELTRTDRVRVPAAIAKLQEGLAGEKDAVVRAQMAETLAGYQEHLTQLEALDSLMRRARLQLEETVDAMGALHARLQLLDAMDVDGPAAQRITEEIDEQAKSLGDLSSALSEAYAVLP
jgi:hypothetical protein